VAHLERDGAAVIPEGLANYECALAALRMRAVVEGKVFPREQEPIDLVLLAHLFPNEEPSE
jgi:hypothetical protein